VRPSLGGSLTEEQRAAWVASSSIPSVVLDAILPPALAFDVGRDAASRADAIRRGFRSPEGVYRPLDGACDCGGEEMALSTKHPKRYVDASLVEDAARWRRFWARR
jgi:hypothetical protein